MKNQTQGNAMEPLRGDPRKIIRILPFALAFALAALLFSGCAKPAPSGDPNASDAPVTDRPATAPEPLTDVEPPVRTLVNPVIPAGTPLTDVIDPGLAELIAAPETAGVRLSYTRYGEASNSIEVDDPEKVSAILTALGNIRIADPAVLIASDAGEGFVFTTADGAEYRVYFELGQLQVEGDFYEVVGAEDLWRSVSALM